MHRLSSQSCRQADAGCSNTSVGSGPACLLQRPHRNGHRQKTLLRAGSRKGGRETEDDSSAGDAIVQESLVDMLRLEIGKKHVETFTEEEKQKLRQSTEEFKEEIDRVAQQGQERSDESFSSALDEIDRRAREFEEELKRSRQQQQDALQDFATWQRRMAVARSHGQFFKNLYGSEEGPATGQDVEMLRQEMKARTADVQASMRSQLASRRRLGLFGFLSSVLAAVCITDAMSDSPSWPQISLYLSLAAVFGVVALAEVKTAQGNAGPEGGEGNGGGDGPQ